MINGFIDGSVNLLIGNISDPFCAPVQERFEFLGDRRTILGRRNLLRGNILHGVNLLPLIVPS